VTTDGEWPRLVLQTRNGRIIPLRVRLESLDLNDCHDLMRQLPSAIKLGLRDAGRLIVRRGHRDALASVQKEPGAPTD
jgi:hypothetical protein